MCLTLTRNCDCCWKCASLPNRTPEDFVGKFCRRDPQHFVKKLSWGPKNFVKKSRGDPTMLSRIVSVTPQHFVQRARGDLVEELGGPRGGSPPSKGGTIFTSGGAIIDQPGLGGLNPHWVPSGRCVQTSERILEWVNVLKPRTIARRADVTATLGVWFYRPPRSPGPCEILKRGPVKIDPLWSCGPKAWKTTPKDILKWALPFT